MSSYPSALQNDKLIARADEDAAAEVLLTAERTDRQLVDLVLAGEEAAFEEIFDRYKRLVASSAARYFRQPEQVEEIIQIVFAKVYFEMKNFRGTHDASLAGWLVRITANSCLDVLRSQKRKPECELTEADAASLVAMALSDRSSESTLSDRDLTEKLLSRLPAEDRALLQMLYGEDMSVSETAAAMGWSGSKVKIRAWRARNTLRKVLKRLL